MAAETGSRIAGSRYPALAGRRYGTGRLCTVWHPPAALFENRQGLKAIFNLAAGVDSLLRLSHVIPSTIPIFRLEDAGHGDSDG